VRKPILDRDGEDLVDGVQLEVFDVPVSVRLATHGFLGCGLWRNDTGLSRQSIATVRQ